MEDDELIGQFLRHKDEEFTSFIEDLFSEEDGSFFYYARALLFKVYEMDRKGKRMTKMQACRYIPSQHAGTCRKYVDIAERKGFLTLRKRPNDKRRIDVIPNDQLKDWVKHEMNKELRAAYRMSKLLPQEIKLRFDGGEKAENSLAGNRQF